MRKLFSGAVAITGLLATSGLFATSAMAADFPVKAPVYKAAPPPVYNWTGFYVGLGGGGGMWNQDNYLETDPGHIPLTTSVRSGGRGWLATAQIGFDVQVNQNIVLGLFADADWSNLKGTWNLGEAVGNEKQKSAWAVGARAGWLVTPSLLTFVDGGYTRARFDGFQIHDQSLVNQGGIDEGLSIPANTYSGWFLGTGVEYAAPWFPGLFWKNEYRYSSYRDDDLPIIISDLGVVPLVPVAVNSRKDVQTFRSELVYRFNMGGGAVSARY